MPHRLLKSIDGHRGDFLLAGGVAFTVVGYSYVSVTTPGRSAAFSWLPMRMDSHEFGWAWVAVGVFTLISALVSAKHKTLARVAFMALIVPPMLWALIFAGAWLTGAHPFGWVSTVSYALMAWWVLIASDWPNPPERDIEGEPRG